ncbi:hypothetical protein JXM83_04735 [Candidatus Woesearchaeota archaeon]|nr:hypothetical protein [Candidatus Woesearchaeota archaeon]
MPKKNNTKTKKEKKDTNYGAVILSGLIMFLMIGSLFGYMMYYAEDNSNFTFNGFKFTPDDRNNRWIVKLDDKVAEFYNHPTQVEAITVPNGVKNTLMDGDVMFVTFDPVEGEMAPYMDQVRLDFTLAFNAIGAVSAPSEIYTLPVLTCENKTGVYLDSNNQTQVYSRNIIYLKKSNETKIVLDDGCVILEASSGQGFIDLRDRLLFDIYGILGESK